MTKTVGVILSGCGYLDGAEIHEAVCTLLALDRAGLKNLCSLASVAGARNDGDPFVEIGDLDGRADGVVGVVNAPESDAAYEGQLIVAGAGDDDVAESMTALRALFGERMFFGLAPGFDDSEYWVKKAYELDIPAVVTQDVRYVGFKHYSLTAAAHEFPDDGDADAEPVDRYRFLSMTEVAPWYARYAAAYANASMIASLAHPDLLGRLEEPVPASDAPTLLDGGAAGEFQGALEIAARDGFEREYAEAPDVDRDRFRAILEFELEAIRASKRAEPFVRFHEIVSKLRRLDIPLGPSTGLKLQSLTAFLLGITTFNPYEVDEHFVPDLGVEADAHRVLDLQIASADRDATVSVLTRMFEGVGVGYVPSVEHVTPLKALKAAGRGLEIDDIEFKEIVRLAGEHPGVSLKKLCEENREIGRLYRRSAGMRELVTSAATIEGLPIGFVKSRRTLLVSPRPLREYIGFTVNPDNGEVFFQATRDSFPMESVFRVDITTLTSLGACARIAELLPDEGEGSWVWTRPQGTAQETDDEFAHVVEGDVSGLFLLESPLTQRLAIQFGVDSFAELVRFLAIMRYRRGDLSFPARVEAFTKGPPASDGVDPAISFLLNDTNGWVLFDDQLREIVSVLTALPGPDAAALLRGFKRRGAGALAALRREFMGYTVEIELPMADAEGWFKRILYYASRTLDRQHIVADALLVYRMLRLKHRYRAAFFAGLLNQHRGHGARFDVYAGIVAAEGLLLVPNVNRSGRDYLPERGLIRAPLSKIAGLGDETVEAILGARVEGPFENLEDFLRRVPSELVTNKDVELIAAAGAIDTGEGLGRVAEPPAPDRELVPESPAAGQIELTFDGSKRAKRPDISAQKSEPPYIKKDGNIRGSFHVLHTLAEFYPHPSGTRVELVGRVRDLHSFKTGSDYETCFFVLFDASATVPVFVPKGRFGRAGEPPADGDHVYVRGIVRTRDRRRVCDAVEVQAKGGAISHGETTTDEPTEGDS